MTEKAPEGYGAVWQKLPAEEYLGWHKLRAGLHRKFREWAAGKKIKTVLEVGCGYGAYPLKEKPFLFGATYTGIDISQPAIDYCKENSDFNFVCGDFTQLEFTLRGTWKQRFDLVFAHAVIDHVYNPDEFVQCIAKATKKYAFIGLYHGYHPDLKKHEMVWHKENGCYNSKLAPGLLRHALLKELKPTEFTIDTFYGSEGAILIERETT